MQGSSNPNAKAFDTMSNLMTIDHVHFYKATRHDISDDKYHTLMILCQRL